MEYLSIAVLFETSKLGKITLCTPVTLIPGIEDTEKGVFINFLTGEHILKTDFIVGKDKALAYNVVASFDDVNYGYYDGINQNVYYHDPEKSQNILVDSPENVNKMYGIVTCRKETVEKHNDRVSAYIDSLNIGNSTMNLSDNE